MHYEISVGRGDDDGFSTHPDTIQSAEKARRIYDLLLRRFPPDEGWVVKVLAVHEIGEDVTDQFTPFRTGRVAGVMPFLERSR